MTAGFIFVIAILALGGVIATVSDRLGTKVGKARLSLFKMRPRKTAAVVTVFTGTLLSALTLAILFATSKPLRRGVFTIDQIQDRLNQARKDLTRTEDEKERVETQLTQAEAELLAAVNRLNQINASLQDTQVQVGDREAQLQQAQNRLQNTEEQLQELQEQLTQMKRAKTDLEAEFEAIETQLSRVSTQKQQLQTEIGQLQAEREKLIEQRETVEAQIEERDREIERQDRVIAERETRLAELEVEQEKLEQQKAEAERDFQLLREDFQLLREGSVALKRGQILASGLVRIIDPDTSEQAVNQLLQEANRNALNFVQLGNENASSDRVIQITKAEVEELIAEIDDGRDHVVQIIAAANYLVGEKRVAVYTKAEPNRLLFTGGEIVAGTSVNPATLDPGQLQQHLQQLLDASGFRARFVGVLDGPIRVGDDSMETLIAFIQRLETYDRTVELQAVASRDTYTIGPLQVDLLARHNGEVVFSTRDANRDLEDINWAEVWPR